jgi:hypothetical protein
MRITVCWSYSFMKIIVHNPRTPCYRTIAPYHISYFYTTPSIPRILIIQLNQTNATDVISSTRRHDWTGISIHLGHALPITGSYHHPFLMHRPLPICLDRLVDISTTFAKVQVIRGDQSARLLRVPFCALSRRDIGKVHGVDFLKGALAGFHEKEIDDDSGEEVAACKDVAVAEVDGGGDESGEEGEHEVPEP